MRILVAAAVAAVLARSARAADLDAFAPKTCAELDRQLAPGGEVLAAFNATSRGAVDALRAGRPAEGCPALRRALRFNERAAERLAACADAGPDNPKLLAGLRDLQRQIERIGHREGCLPGPES